MPSNTLVLWDVMRLWVDCLTVPLREAYDSSVAGGDHIKMRENMRSQHVRNTAETRGQNTLSQGAVQMRMFCVETPYA